jgi:drug/metabolite transporter (DMT)-like permease
LDARIATAASKSIAGTNQRTWIIVALLTVYIVWGTTYLGIRYALESFPPFLMMGIRFVVAGGSMFLVLVLRGTSLPTLKQWCSAAIVGALLLGGGMGCVALAEESVSSGLAATLVATAPILAMLFSLIWGHRPRRMEWIGVAIGLVGVAVLSMEGNLRANPAGIALLVFAPTCWALGSVWSNHLDMPRGLMGNAAEMLMGGLVLLCIGLLRGEAITAMPTPTATLALVYLIIFGSLAALSAYMFLLKTVPPALATSYAFVNPVIALLLGVVIGGEKITGSALIALPIIILGLVFVILRKQRE